MSRQPKASKDFFVYGWYESGNSLPFYIGKGSGKRSTAVHYSPRGGHKEACQLYRECCKGFHVKIFKRGLTESDAYLVETVLIKTLGQLGGCSCNTQSL